MSGTEHESGAGGSDFEIFERLIAEAAATGESRTLRSWVSDARERLEAYRAGRPGPREARAASRIEAAFTEAEALLGRCLPRDPGDPKALNS